MEGEDHLVDVDLGEKLAHAELGRAEHVRVGEQGRQACLLELLRVDDPRPLLGDGGQHRQLLRGATLEEHTRAKAAGEVEASVGAGLHDVSHPGEKESAAFDTVVRNTEPPVEMRDKPAPVVAVP